MTKNKNKWIKAIGYKVTSFIILSLCFLFIVVMCKLYPPCTNTASASEYEKIYVDETSSNDESSIIINNEADKEETTKNVLKVETVSIDSPYKGYITEHMDLLNRMIIDENDMNIIIDHFTEDYPDSILRGEGKSFVEASKESGYDPIFLLALVAQQNGWNIPESTKYNPYIIYGLDSSSYLLADTFNEGIINGSVWLLYNYYHEGEKTIYQMSHGDKKYATDENWVSSIVSIMDASYKLIT